MGKDACSRRRHGHRRSRRRTRRYEEIKDYIAKKKKQGFVWRKKIQRDLASGAFPDSRSDEKELEMELDKLRKQKEQRALDRAQREEEAMARERARRADSLSFETKEDEFLLGQSRLRSHIRLREGRPKPIDLLTTYLDDHDHPVDDPCLLFKGLDVDQLHGLHRDLQLPLRLDRATPTHTRYWQAIMVVLEWELGEATRRDANDRATVRGEQPPAQERGLHPSIQTDVTSFFQGKAYEELAELEDKIEKDMQTAGKAKVVEYWEAVLKRLRVYKAKAALKEIHANMLRKHLRRLEQPLQAQNLVSEDEKSEDAQDDLEVRAKKVMGGMGKGDAVFGSGAEVNLDSQVSWWRDKYCPEKPKYSNCVHTGYEWNMYNRTHYEHDNPPPKFVQGYKFNIFYPDLVDKHKAPSYFIEKDGDSAETCIIRFEAGPPYEDIAFRIANKEWEYSRKQGYKCTFDRGVLHVHFNCKRYRYRR